MEAVHGVQHALTLSASHMLTCPMGAWLSSDTKDMWSLDITDS